MIPTLHIQLMGGFKLRFADAPVVTLDHPRLQALLAYLVLQRAIPQSRQQLAFLLWPDSTESQARTNLRSLIHRLRQALPEADRFLHIEPQTIHWRADASCTLDVAAFEQALARAASVGQRGDQTAACGALQEAVERYGGDLLPSWYDDWILLERERLRQAFLAALEQLIVLLEQAQDYPTAIGYAQRLLRHDPLHEATYQHLMRLHTLSGDRASAVRAYQTCVVVLERELGVEPSSATHQAYERILHLQAEPVDIERPFAPASDTRQHNLPLALTSFIGRATERAEVTHLLTSTRLLTLTGTGGCGKTRLALVVASDLVTAYRDGVWLVELASLADEALAPQVVATTLGVQEQAQRPLTATLVDALRSRDMLLVLDNCEHLIDACAHLAERLLVACPQLRILATSREALGIASETIFLVPSLPLPDVRHLRSVAKLAQVEAVRLFIERAAAVLPTFTLTQANAAAVAQICRRLDGIPLAIELAAARIKVLAVDQLATRLDYAMELLTSGSRTAQPRQQTLRAAIDWSYDLLSQQEQALFRRLCVFAGGWTLEAAETVCVGDTIDADEVLKLLAHLVDKSLVVVVDPPREGQVRYRLLEPMRQYAQEKLRETGAAEGIQRQHAHFFLLLAEAAAPELRGARAGAWLDRLEQERDNLRVAFQWMVASPPAIAPQESEVGSMALRLGVALYYFWEIRGPLSEGRRWLKQALSMFDSEREAGDRSGMGLRAQAFNAAGRLAFYQGEYAAALSLYENSLAICRALTDLPGIASALDNLGSLAFQRQDYTLARSLYEESLAIRRQLENQAGIACSLANLAVLLWSRGDHAGAAGLYQESLALYRELGDVWGVATSLGCLGTVAWSQGDDVQAATLLEESVTLYRALGNNGGAARSLINLGIATWHQGDYVRAAVVLQESLALSRSLEDRLGIAWSLLNLGVVAWLQGNNTPAAALLAESLPLYQALGDRWGCAECLEVLAGLACDESAQDLNSRTAKAAPGFVQATRLLGAAEALRRAINASMAPAYRTIYDTRILTMIHTALDSARVMSKS